MESEPESPRDSRGHHKSDDLALHRNGSLQLDTSWLGCRKVDLDSLERHPKSHSQKKVITE